MTAWVPRERISWPISPNLRTFLSCNRTDRQTANLASIKAWSRQPRLSHRWRWPKMRFRSQALSSDQDVGPTPKHEPPETPCSLSTAPAREPSVMGEDVASTRTDLDAALCTIVADPVQVGTGDTGSIGESSPKRTTDKAELITTVPRKHVNTTG
jgi:hypothetical protein